MRKIEYIIVSEDVSCKPGDPRLREIRHYHIVDGSGLSREEFIPLLLFARHHWPEAKILGVSEIDGAHIHPSESMNQIRRKLSDLT